MQLELILSILAAAVQAGTPILFATLGEMLTERSGVLNLGVEGMMIVGALTAFVVLTISGSPWLAFVCAGLAAGLLGGLHGVVCLVFQGNQVVSGLALTILGLGLADYLGTPFVGVSTPGFGHFPIPFLADIPILGDIFFQQDALVYVSYLLPIAFWVFLYRTSLGMALRSAGEHPSTTAAVGLNPMRMRWLGVMGGGFLVGLGGAYLSLAYTHMWTSNMTAGRGWIAVALVIFAFWRPGRAVYGAYLFGGVMAFQMRIQALGVNLPSSLLHMLPYLLTIGVLLLSSLRGRVVDAPANLGVNIEPEG